MRTLYKQSEMTVETNENRVFNLEYYLIEELLEDSADVQKLYGIQIVKKENGIEEKESISTLSYSKDYVIRILEQLSKHSVTPICMLETIDDLVTLYESAV